MSIFFIIGLSLLLILSGGCSTTTGEKRATFTATPVIISTNTSTSSPWQEKTAMPSSQTKNITQITFTPSLTVPPTTIPTLLMEDANQTVLGILTSNDGCRLPCLWGITPGESGFQDVLVKLWPLSGISEFTAYDTGVVSISPVYNEGDLYILTSIHLSTYADGEIVKNINFKAGSFHKFQSGSFAKGYSYSPIYDIPSFGRITAIYMLPGILSEYGRPESVLILTFGGPPGQGSWNDFEIVLTYPAQGMLVHYTTKKRMVGDNIMGCMANAHVEFDLFPSGNAESFMDLLGKATYWDELLVDYKPVEELTSMSIDEFYKAFSQPTEKCITIPNKSLPTWQP
jgi:hypothetical protein